MNTTKEMKRILSIFLALALLLCQTVLAEESEAGFTQAENAVVTTQPLQQPVQTEKPAKEDEDRVAQQTPSVEDVAAHSARNQEGSLETSGPISTSSIDDVQGEEPSIVVEEKTLPTELLFSEVASPVLALEWKLSSEDGFLRAGDSIALVAKITTEAESLPLQWQIATKPTSTLTENEAEWEDVSGANGAKYNFTIQEGMQAWRWRLCATLPNGGAMHSSEISLPEISAREVELIQTEEVEAFSMSNTAPSLPIADITLTADIPLEEIAYGDEVTLVADIHNPREDMLLQWQHMPAEMESDKNAWESVEGANESSYTYVVSEENVEWIWRLLIAVPEEIAEPGAEPISEGEAVTEEEVVLEATPAPEPNINEVLIEEQPPEAEAIEAVGIVEE